MDVSPSLNDCFEDPLDPQLFPHRVRFLLRGGTISSGNKSNTVRGVAPTWSATFYADILEGIQHLATRFNKPETKPLVMLYEEDLNNLINYYEELLDKGDQEYEFLEAEFISLCEKYGSLSGLPDEEDL